VRDPSRLPPASRELLRRLGEAGGVLTVPSLPVGLDVLVGRGIVFARKVDGAFFSAQSAPAPSGLGALSGIQTVVDAGAFADLDACAEAISLAETVGATETSFVTSPATALALAKVKTGTGSNARCSVMTPPQRPVDSLDVRTRRPHRPVVSQH